MSDDPAFNIKFVEMVEKYSCIYDYTRQDHSKRDVVEKSWSAIARELKLSSSQCKEKWKNLRTALARSMKKPPSGSGAKKIKDYYLKDVMQFVTPFMKSKPQQGNLPTETELSLNEEYSEFEEAEMNEDNSEQDITASVESQEKHTDVTPVVKSFQTKNSCTAEQCSNTRSIGPSEKRKKVSTSTSNEADKCFIDFVKAKTRTPYSDKEKSNPDLQFLASLLPDVAKLTDYQKRKFKRKTLELLDELLCDGPLQSQTVLVESTPAPSPDYSNYSAQSNVSTYSSHSFSTREDEEQRTPVQTYIQTFAPGLSKGNFSFQL